MRHAPCIVITGTTHGIGRVVARELAQQGARLLMLVRDAEAGQALARQLADTAPATTPATVIRCDLASLASVREAADAVAAATDRIDVLIHNAGIVSTTRQRSADGFERVFAVNHLGPFLLTERLRARVPPGGRIVITASCAHVHGRLNLAQVAAPDSVPYRPQAAYAQSKLANVLHTLALARRMADSGVAVNCLHPGVVRSNLLPRWVQLLKPLVSRGMIDVDAGARSTLYLAHHPDAARLHGCYIDEHQRVQAPSALALDHGLQEALWAASLCWVGLG